MVNGISDIAITKLDVLDSFDSLNICIGYELNGKFLKSFPTDIQTLENIKPVYESFAGWKSSTTHARSFHELPSNAQTYVNALARLTGTTISMISVGARRDQTIILNNR